MEVAIIDYKMSNLHSVKAACNKIGVKSIITSKKNEILDAKIAILPGVGAFNQAMKLIEEKKILKDLENFVKNEKLF